MKNPLGFAWEIGQYKNPGVIVPPRGPVPAPAVPCPGQTVIYASDSAIVANCAGFVGFGGGNPFANPIVLGALAQAAACAAKATCANPCNKVASLIWIGWDCGGAGPLTAVAGAEIEVECVLPDPTAIARFKDACRGLDELPAPIFLGHGWSLPKKRKTPKRKRPKRKAPRR